MIVCIAHWLTECQLAMLFDSESQVNIIHTNISEVCSLPKTNRVTFHGIIMVNIHCALDTQYISELIFVYC